METFKKQAKRPASNPYTALALLGLFLSLGAPYAVGEGLEAYGARMCAEAGVPPENCSLVTDPAVARNAAFVREDAHDAADAKAATLVEHGRRVCEQENVPLEDCQALPSAYRAEQAPATAFLTAPHSLPPVDPALVPAAPPPMPATRHVVRDPQPAPLPVRPAPAAPVLAGDPDVRYLRPPPAAPVYRYAPAAAPTPALPLDPNRRYVAPPPEPVGRPIYRYAEEPAPVVERDRPERLFQEERYRREERFFRGERFVRDERLPRRERVFLQQRSGRCLRAVRYSAPPSYRYITC
ncbi:MAG: hypothetical protein ACR2RA_23440 [Geminicoccaceae bacterium]